jgi:hypothetical protein
MSHTSDRPPGRSLEAPDTVSHCIGRRIALPVGPGTGERQRSPRVKHASRESANVKRSRNQYARAKDKNDPFPPDGASGTGLQELRSTREDQCRRTAEALLKN